MTTESELGSLDVEALANQRLIAPDDTAVRLGDLWADRPQVILCLRHFG